MKRFLTRATVILLAVTLAFTFVPFGGVQKAYAESGSDEIANVKIDENGIMTWDEVPGNENNYRISIDGCWFQTKECKYDIRSAIDRYMEDGHMYNSGIHYIRIEAKANSKIYTWRGNYKYFFNNIPVDTISRYYGSTRYETSIKVARAYMEAWGFDELDYVILACGSNYADALAGSYLSANGFTPILLVDGSQAHINAVQDFIKEYLTEEGTIYLLGGPAVVPDSVTAGLEGYKVKRLGGNDRYETNLLIIQEAEDIYPYDDNDIMICSGTGFADSLSAAASGMPVLLVKGNSLSDAQMNYLQKAGSERKITMTVVGGEGAVSSGIFNQLKNYGDVYRVGGRDRYETSELFAEYWFKDTYYDVGSAVLAFGGSFPDGLCGGSLAFAMDAPLLLTANGKTDQAAKFTRQFYDIGYGAVLGGPALISDASAKAIFDVDPNSNVMVK